MASTMLESEAEFASRARQINMDESFFSAIQAAGIKTFGKLAYICAVSPQSGDDTPLLESVERLLGRKLEPAEIPDLRRLWYEANTFAISDLKLRVERSSLDPPRELPLAGADDSFAESEKEAPRHHLHRESGTSAFTH